MPSDLRRVELSLRKALERRKNNAAKDMQDLRDILESPDCSERPATKEALQRAEGRLSAHNIALWELDEALDGLQTIEKYRRQEIGRKLSLLSNFYEFSDENARNVTKEILTFILEEML